MTQAFENYEGSKDERSTHHGGSTEATLLEEAGGKPLTMFVPYTKRGFTSNVRSIVDGLVNWLAVNARSFRHLLPYTLEIALYLCLAAYYAAQLAQQQA
jgi:hypothetical protein